MGLSLYHILHVSALFVLLGGTAYAFAAPAETRRRVLMITGIATLIVFVTGFGMLQRLGLGFPLWAIVKTVCWLGLSALTGIAYRRRAQAGPLMWLALVLAVVAVVMVYLKPF
jgi:hypothetical protein